MNFKSDNTAGAAPEIITAIARANAGSETSYGADAITKRLTEKFSELFDKDVAVFPVATGTAANALALATLVPPYGAIFCHENAHINVDECGAPEFYAGAKLVAVSGTAGKLSPDSINARLGYHILGDVHHTQPAAISITQATERGTVYTPAEVQVLSRFAKKHGMSLHMDGARFGNAIAQLGCKPAEITWKAGVDALSIGFTKTGAIAAEAVVFFDPERAADFAFRRKRSGHLISKMRFVSAQIEAMLDANLWLRLAAHANAAAARLGRGLEAIPGFSVTDPVEANEVFAKLPSESAMNALETAGAKFYLWEPVTDGRPLIRLVCAFATTDIEIDEFLAHCRKLAA
jgi:threonine aldolase